jgi:hypothetical protein
LEIYLNMFAMRLKRIILILLFLFIVVPQAASQIFWIRTGAQYCRVTGLKSNIYDPTIGFHLGGGYERIFSNNIGWKAELNYNQRSFTSFRVETFPFRTNKFYDNTIQRSLHVPILATVNYNRFYFELGPFFDILFNWDQHEKEEVFYYDGSRIVYESYNNREFKNPELGFAFGAGLHLGSGIHLTARYLHSFTPLGNDYQWLRMSQFQVSIASRIGTPQNVMPLSETFSTSASRPYQIISSQNVSRTIISNTGRGSSIVIRWRDADFGAVSISGVNIMSSSGSVNITQSETRINEVIFPATVRINFTVTNNVSGLSSPGYLDFEIASPGNWVVGVFNN